MAVLLLPEAFGAHTADDAAVRARRTLRDGSRPDGAAFPSGEDEHWPIAIGAYARFGKGRHAAGLNFSDCLTYAVASLASQPLLYVGEDFARTDLRPA